MRLKLLVLSTLITASALPALAQAYPDGCRDVRGGRQAAGAVLGAIAGGLVGNGVAANKNRDEGALLGAVVGAVAGTQIGGGSVNCNPTYYGATPSYPVTTYGRSQPYYSGQSSSYQYNAYPSYSEGEYWRGGNEYDSGYASYRSDPQHRRYKHLEGDYDEGYNRAGDYAGRECADAKQITRLPDGTEIHKPVEACRVARYGDWKVRN